MTRFSSRKGAHFASPASAKKTDKDLVTDGVTRADASADSPTGAQRVEIDLSETEPRRRRHWGRAVLVIVLVALVVTGVYGFALYRSAQTVLKDARTIKTTSTQLLDAVKSGDATALKDSTDTIVTASEEMHSETSGVLWTVGCYLPVVGHDVSNARALSDVAFLLSNDVARPLATDLSGFSMKSLMSDGRVNVAALETLSDSLVTVAPVIEKASKQVSAMTPGRVDKVNDYVAKAKEKLVGANQKVQMAASVAPVLPQLFGADGKARTYLVVAQNNAELRSTGGLPGSRMLLTVTNGRIELGESIPISEGFSVDLPLQDDEAALLGTAVGTAASWANATPNFVRAGQLLADGWERGGGSPVEGVIAIDPVFLQRLLALSGGVTASDGTVVNGDNAAQVLMSDIYWKYGNNGRAQDAVFSEIAGLSFKKVMSSLGDISVNDLAKTIEESRDDHRLLIWMRDEAEERAIKGMGFSGELGTDPAKPVLGVYLNDNSYSKIDWYMQVSNVIDGVQTNQDGTKTYTVTSSFTNTLTPDQAAEAPEYITGYNELKADKGDMITLILLVAPAGSRFSGFESGAAAGPLYGLDARFMQVHIEPQQTVTYTYQVTCAADAEGLGLRTTPIAQPSLSTGW